MHANTGAGPLHASKHRCRASTGCIHPSIQPCQGGEAHNTTFPSLQPPWPAHTTTLLPCSPPGLPTPPPFFPAAPLACPHHHPPSLQFKAWTRPTHASTCKHGRHTSIGPPTHPPSRPATLSPHHARLPSPSPGHLLKDGCCGLCVGGQPQHERVQHKAAQA